MSQQESRFSVSKKISKQGEGALPARLQSILTTKSEPTQKKKFTPKIPSTRTPKLQPRRKSSELAAEHGRSETVAELQHSLQSTLLVSKQEQDPRSLIINRKPRPPAKVAFGLTKREEAEREIERKQKKELDQNTWLANQDTTQYIPITLPFFDLEVQKSRLQHYSDEEENPEVRSSTTTNSEVILDQQGTPKENQLFFMQLPKVLPLEEGRGGSVGKLQVFKSGKMQMTIGNQKFEVLPGVPTTFHQEVASISQDSIHILGPVSNKLIVAPNLFSHYFTLILHSFCRWFAVASCVALAATP
mmetsp:Transcript_12755/g.18617  ORF Transcript_12755/g.18617 Transcript_12755/m.18617 type:complete len:302 (-) Transcript_12755:501-1406(-)